MSVFEAINPHRKIATRRLADSQLSDSQLADSQTRRLADSQLADSQLADSQLADSQLAVLKEKSLPIAYKENHIIVNSKLFVYILIILYSAC